MTLICIECGKEHEVTADSNEEDWIVWLDLTALCPDCQEEEDSRVINSTSNNGRVKYDR